MRDEEELLSRRALADDVVLVHALVREIDALHQNRDVVGNVVAEPGIELPVIVRVLRIAAQALHCRQEAFAFVPSDPRADPVLLVEQHHVGGVLGQARHGERGQDLSVVGERRRRW